MSELRAEWILRRNGEMRWNLMYWRVRLRVGKGEKLALALYSSWVLSFEWKMLEDVLRSCSCNFDSAEVLHLAGLL